MLRNLLARGRFFDVPGVYDGITALAAQQAGFDALYLTGYGLHATLGLPDMGLATPGEFVDRISIIRRCSDLPLIVDADSGFGNIGNLRRAVMDYERAGAAAMQIDDQESPRRCGHTDGKRVVPIAEMTQRIRVALDHRTRDGMLIIARTDAIAPEGFDAALKRCDDYANAGADILFVDAPETESQLAQLGKHSDIPMMVNVVPGGRTPVLPASVLAEMGFAFAIYPSIAWLASAGAIQGAFAGLRRGEVSAALSGPPLSANEGHALVGFPQMWAFEKHYAGHDRPERE
ncbi:isocitrate lyase/PEP mutase family protein [Pseudorhodoplanes sp.]|uniref:isocitrate lyase/PEP mutase family protein n=1 Tax=Pseudorhodoplanes sp. TaxID=1934341 RepID=UPI002C8D6E10|nr:isocitrate lyase/PEP mutase family protein [Pseudorhodoplanes sp.]HWV51643.1 isocitrate lyase/PEP mutase family protein [Pseudorhodoplanes sp.]